MSNKSRTLSDWLLMPFLAVLTIGLAKPSAATAGQPEATTQQPKTEHAAAAETAEFNAETNDSETIEVAASPIPVAAHLAPDSAHVIDPDRSRAFHLAARLSATAQLNRPKPVAKRAKKVSPAANSPRWTRPIKVAKQTKTKQSGSAKIIAFPKPNQRTEIDYSAAA
ncbi:MAG: hypothetical protein K0U74_11110 [Alphaproteobacteria bacterium]|nr:hypothetical protein [Alphaproteobacteria bacterium]